MVDSGNCFGFHDGAMTETDSIANAIFAEATCAVAADPIHHLQDAAAIKKARQIAIAANQLRQNLRREIALWLAGSSLVDNRRTTHDMPDLNRHVER